MLSDIGENWPTTPVLPVGIPTCAPCALTCVYTIAPVEYYMTLRRKTGSLSNKIHVPEIYMTSAGRNNNVESTHACRFEGVAKKCPSLQGLPYSEHALEL